MRNVLTLLMLILTLSLTACATTSSRPLTAAELALQQVKEAREQEHREQMGTESATVAKPGPSAREVIGGIIALPIVIPLAAMVEYGRYPYSSSVHCRSWSYKDQYHATCY